MNDIILQTKDLTKKYGNQTVLDHVNIQLKKKHIYGFIGENGAGKSTFMKIITGLAFELPQIVRTAQKSPYVGNI